MGCASVNYLYKSSKTENLLLLLIEYGVKHLNEGLVLNAPDYWIDLEIYQSGTLSIRIALCNPEAVIAQFMNLLDYLFAEAGGKLFDLQSRKEYRDYLNENDHTEIIDIYQNKKQEVDKWFSGLTLPVSEPEFFRLWREKNNIQPQ